MNEVIKNMKALRERWKKELENNTALKIRLEMTSVKPDSQIHLDTKEKLRKSNDRLVHMRIKMFKLIDLLEET